MKKIILLSLLIIPTSFAEKAPKPFDDSSIKRDLKDGTVQTFDGNEYMIVKRGVEAKPQEPKVVVKEKRVYKKNALKLFIGHGPHDLDKKSATRVDLDRKPFVGIGYQRMLNESFSVEINGNTNESYSIGGGFHF